MDTYKLPDILTEHQFEMLRAILDRVGLLPDFFAYQVEHLLTSPPAK